MFVIKCVGKNGLKKKLKCQMNWLIKLGFGYVTAVSGSMLKLVYIKSLILSFLIIILGCQWKSIQFKKKEKNTPQNVYKDDPL